MAQREYDSQESEFEILTQPNPTIEKQTQINSVLQTPAVTGLLNYLDQSTQFFLQLPNHKTEHFRECSTVRNLHI